MRSLMISLGVVALSTSPAVACTVEQLTGAQQFARADRVYTGTVQSFAEPTAASPRTRTATILVDAVYKGRVPGRTRVMTASQTRQCGVAFAVGYRFIVYATQDGEQSLPWAQHGLGTARLLPSAVPRVVTAVPATFVRRGRLVSSMQRLPRGARPLSVALRALLDGPTRAESGRGLTTAIQPGVTLRLLAIRPGRPVSINVDAPVARTFEAERAAVSQLIRTATTNGATGVIVLAGGQPTSAFSGQMDWRDVPANLAPAPIILKRAVFGRVSRSVSYAGTANTFEANVQIRLRRGARIVARSFTTALCGTGCRGYFSGQILVPPGTTGPLTLEAFEVSARDGSEQSLVSLPVAGRS